MKTSKGIFFCLPSINIYNLFVIMNENLLIMTSYLDFIFFTLSLESKSSKLIPEFQNEMKLFALWLMIWVTTKWFLQGQYQDKESITWLYAEI